MSSYIPRSLFDQAKPETSDPTYRMSMLPLGTYPNADGSGEHLGFAIPGMVQEPMNALMRLIGTPSQPGTFGYGPDVGIASDNPVRSQFPAQEDMRTLLESTFGGNATRGMGAVERGAVEVAPSLEPAFQAYLERRANRKPVVDYQGTPDTNLPMDLTSQLQRANDQGFDTNNVWYHGTPHGSFDAFDLSEVDGRRGATNNGFRGISMTPNKAEAADYASSARAGADPTVYALYSKANNPFVWNVDQLPETFKRAREVYPDLLPTGDFPINDRPQFSEALAKAGYDALDVIDRGRLEERAVFDPANIRSVNAAFDPANAGKNGLLFSDNLPSLWSSALQGQQPTSRDPLLDIPPAIVQEAPGLSQLKTFASGGNVADTSGLSGLRSIPDYGFGPMTPTTQAGYPNTFMSSREPDPTWGDLALSAAEFPARALVDQFNAAGKGIAQSIDDPSLANITNAGVNTGLALMSPELTIASGLGGLGLAALQDANIIPSAEARSKQRMAPQPLPVAQPAAPEVDPVFEKIKDDPSLVALYQQIKTEQNNATRDYPGRNGDASRAAAASRVQELQNQFSSALAARDAQKQSIYNQQVQDAIASRDTELGRDRRFSDTAVGKVYDKLGGYAPLVAGLVPGVVSRLAYGPAKTIGSALLRDLEGATFGVGANNVPLAYNAFATEVDNPEQRAYATYAYNLPEGHPDKVKAQEMADTLPKLNPVRTGAAEELYDPMKFGERAAMGAMEGWGGNRLGQMLPGGIGGIFRPSSYKLPPEAPAAIGPAGPVSPAQPGAAAKLLADTQTALPESSDLIGPATSRSLPALADVADTVPVSSAPARKPRGARRSKSAGSTEPVIPEQTLPASDAVPTPDKQSQAADELKRFLGFRLAPSPKDLKAAGGAVEGHGGSGRPVAGALDSDVAGRTDHLPIDVYANSYVFPADFVSSLGEGNTLAGKKVLQHLMENGPDGQHMGLDDVPLHYASGGTVPIMAAGGEFVAPPHAAARWGGGDINRAHEIFDKWVTDQRANTINTLKSLPAPQK